MSVKLEDISESTSEFPFKQSNGKRGVEFRQELTNSDGTGIALEIAHNGHDYILLDFRELYKKEDGNGVEDRRYLSWSLDSKTTVQLASVLTFLADELMRDSNEEPYIDVVTSPDKVSFGANWIREEIDTSIARIEKRRSRSCLYGLAKRCIEMCEDEEFLKNLAVNLAMWAEDSGDEYAIQQIDKTFSQMGLIPAEIVN